MATRVHYDFMERKHDNGRGKQAGVVIYRTARIGGERRTDSLFLPMAWNGEVFLDTIDLYKRTWANDAVMYKDSIQAYMSDVFAKGEA